MSVSTSLTRRVLVLLVVVVVTVCALASQRSLGTSAAADTVAATPVEMRQMGSTDAVLTRPTVMDTEARTVTGEVHGGMDCGGIVGGSAHACVEAVTALGASTALALGVRMDGKYQQRGRHPTRGHLVSYEWSSPPWTVLSLAKLSVSRV
ncbi:hypothetical protein CH286_25785 [Rhodococcus sp. WWJCD1]|uniref:hypothetical protein n=1 Tax=unclassified Rhodococcus (in: high G+C Gram-positive bacteria) TaxID=192944 RepID=UPI000B9BA03C|nr:MULTISPECIES: hypothetical protein [unclassified Rhodococcus (in: high G+C Gram-positive bacteria)]OZC42561.1 hypothetical protein CH286_25785 [Rhodococcus sp. WWJCD1]OZE89362.1 hypothetical protein CH302_28780 [Rhodococcus sp. 15-2388-1-1a]